MTRPHVYVLYTGGTIGCAGTPLAPLSADKFAKLIAAQPGFTEKDSNHLVLSVNVNDEEEATIDVTVDDIKPAIDSSSMTPHDWVTIAQRILANYTGYTGLVVLHGTDTMAFSSSAVSYLLGKGVSKPIIFTGKHLQSSDRYQVLQNTHTHTNRPAFYLITGSQVPLSKTRNDAQRNLVSSITVAATQSFNEVALFFDSNLLRGNRAVKMSSSSFHAFFSPNHAAIGHVGIDIVMSKPMLLPAPPADESLDHPENVKLLKGDLAKLQKSFQNFSVITIMLQPGLQASTIKAMLSGTTPPVKGVVLQAFGAGNAPANEELIEALKEAHDKDGVVLVDITQIVNGGVDLDAYESASGLKHAGCISGYDLTPESALAKLEYFIGKGFPQQKVEEEMMKSFQNDLSREIQEKSDSLWKALLKKRGHGRKVQRLLKKRGASKISK